MTIATLILIIIAAGMWVYAWRRGDGSHQRGVRQGLTTLRNTTVLLLLAFAITGYVSVLSPQDLIAALIGPRSGWAGILLGEGVGMLLPGGPYVILPLVGTLYAAGAGLAPTITMITGWATVALLRLAFEIPFMGWRFTAIRWGLAALLPLLAGGLTLWLFGA